MIEQVTRSNAGAMRERYEQTIGFLTTTSGRKIPVEIQEVGGTRTIVQDAAGNRYTLTCDTGCELEFTQVPSQWYQPDPNHIVYIARKAERQWKRGICDANTSLAVPIKGRTALYTIGLDRGKISQVFYPEPNSAVFDDIKSIKCGLWSKYFAWADGVVWVKDMQIGKVDHVTKTVTLGADTFEQELRDALNRSNADYKVVVND